MGMAMSYGLRAEAVLTDGDRDILDQEGHRLLMDLRGRGLEGAARAHGVSADSLRARLRAMEADLELRLVDGEELTPKALEMIEEMSLKRRLLDEQLAHLWRKPTLTCDGLLIRQGKVLLVRRGRDPHKGSYALPGGIVEYGERAEECVVREVLEETGIRTEVLGLLGVHSDPSRDPRGHFVSLLYLLVELGGDMRPGDDAEDAGFFDPDDLPPMAFDHDRMVREGLRASAHCL
ncbi:MAG: ADP-ribose pyrophosphatase [Methanomassiliicoccales archaeon PtaB.Bin134]|nr:MAG: ADP-ribose pyrophosphatase [Methanomassiliicoccales archaeon PtaB.Bin134]